MSTVTDFSIAGLGFRLHTPQPVVETANFAPFLGNPGQVDFNLYVERTARLPKLPEKVVHRNYDFTVYESDEMFWRCHNDHLNGERPFLVTCCDSERGIVRASYLDGEQNTFSESKNWLARCGFEELLLSKDRVILHASLVNSPFGGLLFSGPSGIGKSTQAKLWEHYEVCEIINGDRPILSRQVDGWQAYGSPYAGSSRCYLNKHVSISAIAMLEQGQCCRIHRLDPMAAFRKLYAEMVINSWNPGFVARACDLAMDLANNVPVYRLICTPDRDAVETLKAELSKGGN